MSRVDQRIIDIWKQEEIPVVYKKGKGEKLKLKLPYDENNGAWIKGTHRNKPIWNQQHKCWDIPKAWFNETIRRVVQKYGSIYVIQPYSVVKKCAPACKNASGFECDCSCLGEYHGSEDVHDGWKVISDTFAVRWEGRELGCRLIKSR
jgi:hypothetical protein